MIRRAVLVAVVFVAVPVAAWAQTRTEAELLAQINKTPGDVAAYLDLAKIYVEQKRYDDAQRMLINAATAVGQLRSNRTLLGGPMPIQVPGPTPPAPPAIDTTKPVQVGRGILEPKKIKDVKPVYPPIAETAKIAASSSSKSSSTRTATCATPRFFAASRCSTRRRSMPSASGGTHRRR